MPSYRLYFFHPSTRGIVRFEDIEADSDKAVIEAAQTYRGSRALEVWKGTIKIHCIAATDLASRLIAMRASTPQQEVSDHHPCHVQGV